MEPKWRGYEKFVRDVAEAMLRADGLTEVVVQHDVRLPGISRVHQIDVYWQYRMAGVLHTVIMDCKDHKRPVDVTYIDNMAGSLLDFPEARGVVVSPVSFTEDAIKAAMHRRLELFVIRTPEDDELTAGPREINVPVELAFPAIVSIIPVLDAQWSLENLSRVPRVAPEALGL